MRRREFIAGLGGAVAWPVAVRAILDERKEFLREVVDEYGRADKRVDDRLVCRFTSAGRLVSEPVPRLEGTVPVDLARVQRHVVLRVVQGLAPRIDCGDTRIIGRRNNRGRSSGRGASNHGTSGVLLHPRSGRLSYRRKLVTARIGRAAYRGGA
jgi:hypothetical protein